MIIFLLSLIPVTRTEIGDGEYFTNMGFIPLFLSFCVCALAYMYFLLGHTHTHTQLELYFHSGSLIGLLFNKILNYLENQMQILRRDRKATTI